MMKDKFEKHGCEFKNESDCEEEFDEEGLELREVEKEKFGE